MGKDEDFKPYVNRNSKVSLLFMRLIWEFHIAFYCPYTQPSYGPVHFNPDTPPMVLFSIRVEFDEFRLLDVR